MPRSTPKPLPLSGGVNLLQDQRFIRDDQCVKSQNLVPTRSGMAAKRLAMDTILAGEVAGGGSYYLSTLALPPANFGAGFVFASRRFDGTPPGTVVQVSPPLPIGDLAHVYWNLPAPYRPLMVPYNKKLYVFAGLGNLITDGTPVGAVTAVGRPGAIIQEVTPGGTLEVVSFDFLATSGGAATELAAVPNVGAIYRNRTLWADFGPGYENYAVLSDPYEPQVVGANFLAANGRHFQVGARDGDRIVAAREIMQTSVGSPSEAALLILRQYSGYIITGEPNLVADGAFVLGQMKVNRINVDCGCSSADTLVNTPYGLLWAGWDDVWFFPQGSIPIRVGSYIRPILQATPPELRYLWHASYFDGFYRLHLLSPGQNEGDQSQPGEEWRLDLRGGAPKSHEEARWTGPNIYLTPTAVSTASPGVIYQVADTRPGIVPRLVGLTRGGVLEFMVQFEKLAARDFESLDVATIFGAGSYLHDTEILVDWIGKEDAFGDPIVQKGYTGLEMNMWASRLGWLTVTDVIDGGRTISTTSEVVPNVGLLLDIGVLDTDLLSREFQSFKFDADEDTRPNGLTHQLRIQDSAGYVVNEANDTMVFVHNAVSRTATLTHGLYADKGALLDHIMARMLAASGIVFTHNQGASPGANVIITAASGTWTTDVDASTVSRRAWVTLGYDAGVDPAAALALTAPSFMMWRQSPMLEFAGTNANIFPIRRRAT